MGVTGSNMYQKSNMLNANRTTAEPWDDKKAMNQLYNKRSNNYEQVLADTNGQQVYRNRMATDKNLAQYQKEKNDGKRGHVPWGAGFNNKMQTSSGAIGSHFKKF